MQINHLKSAARSLICSSVRSPPITTSCRKITEFPGSRTSFTCWAFLSKERPPRQQNVAIVIDPVGGSHQFSFLRILRNDLIKIDPSVFRLVFGFDVEWIVPEINPVHIAKIEPEPHVMRMIGTLKRPGTDRVAPGLSEPQVLPVPTAGKAGSASSVDSTSSVANLFDGDPKDAWKPALGEKNGWVEVDLGEDVKIGNFSVVEP